MGANERLRDGLNFNLDQIPLGSDWYEQFTPIDHFDSKLFQLERRMWELSGQYLEELDQPVVEGWASKLFFYQIMRRGAFKVADEIGLRTEPGEILEWDEFLTELNGESFIFTHGNFRLLPTKGQMDLVLGGATTYPEIKSVLMIEPQENIEELKWGLVLPRWIRSVSWKMLPGVDVTVNIPRFYNKDDRLAPREPEEWERFWNDRYSEISGMRQPGYGIFQSIGLGQEWSKQKLERCEKFGIIPVEIDQSEVSYISPTHHSDDLLKGYDYFVEEATKAFIDWI